MPVRYVLGPAHACTVHHAGDPATIGMAFARANGEEIPDRSHSRILMR